MSNRIQLRRTATPGNIPLLANLLVGELVVNLADDDLFYSDGSQVVQLNHAANIRTDATHRFVTDADIASWNTPYTLPEASATVLGGVKIGSNIQVDPDGTIHLDAADATHTGVLTSADWATFDGKQDALGYTPVDKAGDTMLGTLVLAGNPVNPNDAANKTYVDDGLSTKLGLGGGTMTGALILSGDPTAGLGAATKDYVDSAVSNISGEYAAPVQDLVELAALAYGALPDKQLRLVEDTGAIYRYDVQSVETADGVDVIVSNGNAGAGRWIKVQSMTQQHNSLYGLQGGAAGDYLHLTTTEKNSYDAHIVDAALHMTPAQSTFLDAINASATEINYLIGVTSPVQTQLDGKQDDLGYVPVNVAGDTMLGMLSLFADPTNALHAATKNYCDTMTVDGGVF